MQIRRSHERGHADHGWLDTFHTFSFAGYHDPEHMGFGTLRVINQDRVAPGRGFPDHGHRDMEIVSYVLEGALEHEDSMGTGSVIRPGDVQRMSAGTGVIHSEYNASKEDWVQFLQIWILPERARLTPGYEQKNFGTSDKRGKLRLIGSRDARDGSVTIHQDVDVYAGLFGEGESARHELREGRGAYIHVARGSVEVNAERLGPGDGASITEPGVIEIRGIDDAEMLLFDLVPG